MHTWAIVAFLLFASAAIVSSIEKTWVLALIAAGLAAYIVPVVFNLNS